MGGPFSRVFGKNAAKHSSLAHGAQSHEKVDNEEATRGLCLSLNIDKALYAWVDHFRAFSERMPRNIHHLRIVQRVTKKFTMKRQPESCVFR